MPTQAAQNSKDVSLEDILFKKGLLSSNQLSQLKLESINSGQSVDKILIARNMIPMDQILQAKATLLNVPYIKLEGKAVPTDVLNLVPEAAARRYQIFPFDKQGDVLFVAMADPLDIQVIQFIEKRSGKRIKPYLSLPADILKAVGDQYGQNLTGDVTSA